MSLEIFSNSFKNSVKGKEVLPGSMIRLVLGASLYCGLNSLLLLKESVYSVSSQVSKM